MKFQMIHENYNVADLERSIAFYKQALGLRGSETAAELQERFDALRRKD